MTYPDPKKQALQAPDSALRCSHLYRVLRTWFAFYNHDHAHQALNNLTPDEVYYNLENVKGGSMITSLIYSDYKNNIPIGDAIRNGSSIIKSEQIYDNCNKQHLREAGASPQPP